MQAQAKRFIAADMRRALDMVKEEFGDDALIVSTQRTQKGVEIVASGEVSIEEQLAHKPADNTQQPLSTHHQKIAAAASRFQGYAPTSTPPQGAVYPSHSESLSYGVSAQASKGMASGKTQQQLADEMEAASKKMLAAKKAQSTTLESWANQQLAADKASNDYRGHRTHNQEMQQYHQQQGSDQEIQRLHDEIADMRNTLELQLAQMAKTQERQYSATTQQRKINASTTEKVTPIVADITRQLALLDLPKACNDQLVNAIKKNNMPTSHRQKLWTHVLAELSRQLPNTTKDPVSKGGVFAFLGTTGVGKTTTIAKLAARYVMQHGSDRVVLLTTDNYRIASHNQLRSLAKILNVDVHVVKTLSELPDYIQRFSNQDLVLIDTPGMSHADPLLKQHLHLLRRCSDVKNLLVMSANSQYQMLKASLHSYRLAGLHYCVMTKLDESASLGGALGVLYEHELPLAYITDGQAVPEDIDILSSSELVSRAIKIMKSQQHPLKHSQGIESR